MKHMVIVVMRKRVFTKYVYQIVLALTSIMHINSIADQQPTKEVWLTIFVHGIMSVKPHLTTANFLRFVNDKVDDTIYAKTVLLMRNDPYFYMNQAMQGLGLKKIDPSKITKGDASAILAIVFEAVDSFINAETPVTNHYYTFGWSGLMSQKNRILDAEELYKALASEIATFQQQGITPKIRIIGYSHGGNVCLNLARAHEKYHNAIPLSIDETILLGMPVQNETDYLVNDPIFKRIYHIYSRRDRIQKLDFFSFKRFFSRRVFKNRRDFKIPDKLLQIQLKCTRENKTQSQRSTIPGAVYNTRSRAMVSGKSHYLRDASPGHTELWFFGWTPLHYRKNFPLYPLPAVALIPVIAKIAHDFDGQGFSQRPTLIDIRPEHELVLVTNQRSFNVLTVMKFLPEHTLKALKDMAWQYAPDSYPENIYMQHIQDAYLTARSMHRTQKGGYLSKRRHPAKKYRHTFRERHLHHHMDEE
jgi:hypothetical protein